MKLKLINTQLVISEKYPTITANSKQTNFYCALNNETLINGFSDTYDCYVFDLTGVNTVLINRATRREGGLLGYFGNISDTTSLPVDKTWSQSDSYYAFYSLFNNRTAVMSVNTAYGTLTEPEQFAVPSNCNVLVVHALKTVQNPAIVMRL